MNGYVKIKSSEVPFYISLAEDGIKKYEDSCNLCIGIDSYLISRFKASFKALNNYRYIRNMLVKAKDRDIYIDVDSFDLLEKENK